MTYRISTDASGHRYWWPYWAYIPATQVDVRQATIEETELLDRLLYGAAGDGYASLLHVDELINPQARRAL